MHTLGLSFIVTGHRSVFVIEIAPTSNLHYFVLKQIFEDLSRVISSPYLYLLHGS